MWLTYCLLGVVNTLEINSEFNFPRSLCCAQNMFRPPAVPLIYFWRRGLPLIFFSLFSSILWLKVAFFLYFKELKYTFFKGFFFERWIAFFMCKFLFFFLCSFFAKMLKLSITLADYLICINFTSQMFIFCFWIFLYFIESLFSSNLAKNQFLYFSRGRARPLYVVQVLGPPLGPSLSPGFLLVFVPKTSFDFGTWNDTIFFTRAQFFSES